MFVPRLIEAIRRGGEEAHEAALTLGLLIEKEKVHRRDGADGGRRLILGAELAERRLSSGEQQIAVEELIRYVNDTFDPHPMAVWALTKSSDPRIVPHLIRLLDRILDDPNKEDLAEQALSGIITVGLASDDNNKRLSLEAIRRASNQTRSRVRTSARDYLKLFPGNNSPG